MLSDAETKEKLQKGLEEQMEVDIENKVSIKSVYCPRKFQITVISEIQMKGNHQLFWAS